MQERRVLDIVDAHVGGDISRVILGGVPTPPGTTMLERMLWLERHGDGLRQALLGPPLGLPEMCADLVTPASSEEAAFGFIIMESMGYPAMSGSNAICVATVLLETGMVAMQEPLTEVVLDAPAGAVRLKAACRGGGVQSVSYLAPPAIVLARAQALTLDDGRRLEVDIVYGGVVFLAVRIESLGLALVPENEARLAETGSRIIEAAARRLHFIDPVTEAPGRFDFVLFRCPLAIAPDGHASAAIAVFVSPRVICRCPTGTGSTAVAALLANEGVLPQGAVLETRSPWGSQFAVRHLGTARWRAVEAVAFEITAQPALIGRSRVVLSAPLNLEGAAEPPRAAEA